jgi:hypothetical protein
MPDFMGVMRSGQRQSGSPTPRRCCCACNCDVFAGLGATGWFGVLFDLPLRLNFRLHFGIEVSFFLAAILETPKAGYVPGNRKTANEDNY